MDNYQQDDMTSLGNSNKTWGVCGFTSSFYAMYQLNPATRGWIINATQAYRVLAEIKTYLMMLKAENSGLLKEITAFTRTFGKPYKNFNIDTYIGRINQAAAVDKTLEEILKDPLYSIALPPKAVANYLERIWNWKATISEFAKGSGAGDGIIGVSSSEYTKIFWKKPYRGLEHYMYRKDGKVYSWGQSFNSVQEASDGGAGGVPWRVCYVISVA